MAENKERDEQEPEKIVEEIAEDKGEKEETVEDLTKDVADEISKMVKAEVEKSTAGVRKALARLPAPTRQLVAAPAGGGIRRGRFRIHHPQRPLHR